MNTAKRIPTIKTKNPFQWGADLEPQNLDYVHSQKQKKLINDELEIIWKEVVLFIISISR